MIHITPTIAIKENEIKFDFIRASGPGGQNVNKVATAVQLRFDAKNSPAFSDDVRNRLICLAGRRITEHGILIIEAKRFRSQKQNRKNAINRLTKLIRKASEKPKTRIKTKLSLASKKRAVEAKKHRAKIKKMRRPVSSTEDLR
ncbi:MAG: aminoacyl-tRNA hydrolase [Desulfobacterales bacterium]|nr:aminoacyl-tRNA hydrolase [Desulfobacterales bacterium]